jgi:hypothetical protein
MVQEAYVASFLTKYLSGYMSVISVLDDFTTLGSTSKYD